MSPPQSLNIISIIGLLQAQECNSLALFTVYLLVCLENRHRVYQSFSSTYIKLFTSHCNTLRSYLPWRLFWRCARPCFHGNQNWFQLTHSLSSSPSSSSFPEGRWGHLLKNTTRQPIMSKGKKQKPSLFVLTKASG